jgi:ABC-type Zn uptake system ZnuABC Zn-binding protein ZnuA
MPANATLHACIQQIGAVWIAVVLVGVGSLAGCTDEASSPATDEPLFVTTIPPFAAIMSPIVGERGSVVTLLDASDSPHTYEPRPSDVQRVEDATALFYGAPSLDGWAADLPAPRRMVLLDMVPPGFQRPAVANTQAEAINSASTDPHFWTDPLAVRALLPALSDTLCALDAAGCTAYQANADSLATMLIDLDAEMRAQINPVRTTPVLLAQPFYLYFMARYGPDVIGVVEPQPAHEPSPRGIQTLVETARKTGAQAIFVQEQLPPRAAEAVAEGAGISVVPLDPLGGSSERMSYLDLIRYNAAAIRNALLDAPS